MKKKDYISGCFFLILSVILFFQGKDLNFWGKLGPFEGFCPLITSILMGLCSLIIILQAWLHTRQTKEIFKILGPDKRKFLLYLTSFLAFALIFKKVGFVLTQTAFFVFILKVAEKKSWKITLAVTIPSVIIFYIMFVMLFSVELPEGILSSVILRLK